jgi:glycerophosphoryl diester phosphodiesterase
VQCLYRERLAIHRPKRNHENQAFGPLERETQQLISIIKSNHCLQEVQLGLRAHKFDMNKEASIGESISAELDKSFVTFQIKTKASSSYTRIALVGDIPELGAWDLSKSLLLDSESVDSDDEGTITWASKPLNIPSTRFPIKLRFLANGHRSSPNTRPLVWDLASRRIWMPPDNGEITFCFEPTPDDSDSGWVHRAGVGAFQLRVGQPPGSAEPLVSLHHPDLKDIPHRVELFEARGRDPAVPQGKLFAKVGKNAEDEGGCHEDNAATYLLNAQSLEALEFRIDVTALSDGSLIARGFVPSQSLTPLEGSLSAALVSPVGLVHAGTFRAAFLVVTELPHKYNNLGGLQRSRWVPNAPTLDIGHRGSGASRVQGHSVRENTLLSFQKAALNHSDYIEFDVHVTSDGEVVVHHDFEVRLSLGGSVKEELRVAVSTLKSQQLISPEFSRHMITPTEHHQRPAIDVERSKRNYTLKRTMTSAEDMFHSIFNKPHHAMSKDDSAEATDPSLSARAFLSDRIASLREAFARTPDWLGFNIELKYPTEAEMAAMGARFYSRNYFVDAVLKVVLEAAAGRRVIFSTFDPDCATLLSLKQPRYPVLFLTCGGIKKFDDPRMNSLEAAINFALGSQLQGVVAEATSVLDRLDEIVAMCHRHGLFLFTWGDINNDMESYLKQKTAGVDAIIMDDIARIAKATKKKISLFAQKQLRSPASRTELTHNGSENALREFDRLSSSLSILAISPVGSPHASTAGLSDFQHKFSGGFSTFAQSPKAGAVASSMQSTFTS